MARLNKSLLYIHFSHSMPWDVSVEAAKNMLGRRKCVACRSTFLLLKEQFCYYLLFSLTIRRRESCIIFSSQISLSNWGVGCGAVAQISCHSCMQNQHFFFFCLLCFAGSCTFWAPSRTSFLMRNTWGRHRIQNHRGLLLSGVTSSSDFTSFQSIFSSLV